MEWNMGPLFWMPNIVYTNILLWSDANAIMPVMKKRTNDASDKDNIPSSTWTTTKNIIFPNTIKQGIYRRCTLQIQRQLKIIELHTPLKYSHIAIQRCNRAQVQKCMQHHRGHLGAPLTTIHLYSEASS